jgi:hypothetical protein
MKRNVNYIMFGFTQLKYIQIFKIKKLAGCGGTYYQKVYSDIYLDPCIRQEKNSSKKQKHTECDSKVVCVL